ncbi:MAG: hypothetical protein WCY92_01790 [Novosphingobium sp.]|uniref:hypothetical protein n=1 Tax=Tsuneonella sp. CC-YZS046 TaxID=3042152 RepID=UPI002D7A2241|nr:hypothetical protein [Tsuneonella sp. CC-YZS046]WRO66350.1 hypothetical protein U8326_15135 [Tsuneonella sp. CC-YZS046]
MQANIHQNAASQPHIRPLPNGPSVSSVAFRKSLQLTRASTMALTRLQLALTRSDKHQARVAMDCLLDIDAELESFVADLSIPQELDDADWQSISEHLKALKTAIAFEKLVLAGEISGPALASPPLDLRREMEAPEADWPHTQAEEGAPSEYRPVRLDPWTLVVLAALAAIVVGGLIFGAYMLL